MAPCWHDPRIAAGMITPPGMVLYWEMYGPATAVSFSSRREEAGFRFTVIRDDVKILTGLAPDAGMLLRYSRQLRQQLQEAGFTTDSETPPPSKLDGGACWGPAAPLAGSIVDCLSIRSSD